MPLGMTVPAWYNDDHYISEKVDECNTIKFGAVEGEEFTPWTVASVRDFLAEANGEASYAQWMGYDNFVTNGNAENCSPNPLFNVMQYVTAKAAQLNGMNNGAGYEGNNAWTADSVLEYFKSLDISAWDHFTKFGQFENVNPSNAMDLSAFLANKAKQCNDLNFDGKSDWTADSVLAYYQEHGINAVMVAGSASDPNVVAVPGNEAVTAPFGMTPWGVTTTPVDLDLTTGDDVLTITDVPVNFIGTVANTAADTTLNPNDQITGGNPANELTVSMSRNWGGFENGFLKDVPNVSVINDSQNGAPLTWNARGTDGVDNYDVSGWVNLDNLAQTGITVDYSNINNRGKGNALINFADTGAGDDQLNINIGKNVGWLNFQTSGIETITLNSDESNASLNTYADGMQNLVLKGDAVYNIRTMTLSTKSLDMSDLTSDGNFVCLSRSEGVDTILGGAGNDSVSVRNLTPNAVIDGGAGDDSIKLRSTVGAFQLDMKNVETLNVAMAANLDIEREPDADPGAAIALDGSNTTGLQTFGIAGGNGYTFDKNSVQTENARPIYFTNYDMDQVNVKVTGKNCVDLKIDTIQDVIVNVGDGTSAADSITGEVHLLDAKTVAINTTDDNTGAATPFDAALYAANAGSLTLGTAQNAAIDIAGGDLSGVSQLAVSGYSDVAFDKTTQLSNNAKAVFVDADGLIGGDFTASFVDNATEGGATLNYTGTTTGVNNITVDATYNTVSVTGGLLGDTLTIDATNATAENKIIVTGDLGLGDDKVVIIGNGQHVNLEGLEGDYKLVPSAAGSIVPVGTGTTDITLLEGGGSVYLTEKGAVANITADAGGGTISIEGVGGTTANVTCGAGTDIIQVTPPSGLTEGPEDKRDAYLSTTVDDFTKGTDKLDMGDNLNYALGGSSASIDAEHVYKMLTRAGYDVDEATITGALKGFDGKNDHYGACVFELNGSDVKNTAVVQGGSDGYSASVIVLAGVDGTTFSSAAELFASA